MKKSSDKMLPPVGIEPEPLIASDSKLGSLYSHALLIPLKSSKSKYQVVHEQKFEDLLGSTCQVSVERMVLDLELEAMRGPGSENPDHKNYAKEPTVRGRDRKGFSLV